MLDLLFVFLSTVAARAEAPLPAPAVFDRPTRVEATNHIKMLPKAARRAIKRGQAELWIEAERWIVRPDADWLNGGFEESRTGTLYVSEDAGRTWRTVTLPACGNAGCVLRLEKGGALQMMTGSEAPCGGGHQQRMIGHLDGREWQDAPWPWDSPLDFHLPADGWAAGECHPGYDNKDWTGPNSVPCLVDLAGREVHLPVEYEAKAMAELTVDVEAGTVEYRGGRYPLPR